MPGSGYCAGCSCCDSGSQRRRCGVDWASGSGAAAASVNGNDSGRSLLDLEREKNRVNNINSTISKRIKLSN